MTRQAAIGVGLIIALGEGGPFLSAIPALFAAFSADGQRMVTASADRRAGFSCSS